MYKEQGHSVNNVEDQEMTQPDMFGRLEELGILIRGNGRPELLLHIETTLDAMGLPCEEGCKAALHMAFKDFAEVCNVDLRIVKESDALVENNPPGEQPAQQTEE